MTRIYLGMPLLLAMTGCEIGEPLTIKVDGEFEAETEGAERPVVTADCDDTGHPEDRVLVRVEEHHDVEVDLEVASVDVAFLLDSTCSMTPTIGALSDSFGDLADSIEERIPDPAYGYATFDDYNFGHMGAQEDRPFILSQQVTTDRASVQFAIADTSVHYGGDVLEAGMEALYQGLTGAGYDQDGDGVFDFTTDIPPFIASASDPFGGAAGSAADPSTIGGGTIGGFGFRSGSLPVIVYITDSLMRDPDSGDASPGGAPFDAAHGDVSSAALAASARLIGVEAGQWTEAENAIDQMEYLAFQSWSIADADGDGWPSDALVTSVDSPISANLAPSIDAVIDDMMNWLLFSDITARVVGDTHGLTVEVSPNTLPGMVVTAGSSSVELTISVEGEVEVSDETQIFPLTIEVYGEDIVLLGTHSFEVVVPPAL